MRPRQPTHGQPRLAAVTVLAALALLAGPALLAGCAGADDTSPSATPSRTSLSRAPSPGATGTSPSPTAVPSRFPNPTPSPAGTVFDERAAVPCAGRPSGEQIIALLRRIGGFIPSGVNAAVTTGPMCAGTWQYTVVAVPGRDPLQVVTKGAPTALELVTAGTDVCTVDVRALAPAGIRAITRC